MPKQAEYALSMYNLYSLNNRYNSKNTQHTMRKKCETYFEINEMCV